MKYVFANDVFFDVLEMLQLCVKELEKVERCSPALRTLLGGNDEVRKM